MLMQFLYSMQFRLVGFYDIARGAARNTAEKWNCSWFQDMKKRCDYGEEYTGRKTGLGLLPKYYDVGWGKRSAVILREGRHWIGI